MPEPLTYKILKLCRLGWRLRARMSIFRSYEASRTRIIASIWPEGVSIARIAMELS